MAEFTGHTSRSLREILILPGSHLSGVNADSVSLGGYLNESVNMPLGWFSAAMQCVSGWYSRDNDTLYGEQMGISLAQHGGVSVVPRSLTIEHQVEIGERIKNEKAGFHYGVHTVKPTDTIGYFMDSQRQSGHSLYPVVDESGVLVGLMTEKKFHPGKDRGRTIQERMIPREDLITAKQGISLRDANDILLSRGVGILPIIDDNGMYVASVFWRDIKKHVDFPNDFVDSQGRYRYAGAVSTWEMDVERAEALVAADCDILVVDTSQAKGDHGEKMVRTLKTKFPGIPLIAGNIIDDEGFYVLANAGADVVKIGQGPGFGCSTREVKRSGRGQATAIFEVARARDAYHANGDRRVPLIADGGIETTADMLACYALGADYLMMGEHFGQFTESAGPIRRVYQEIRIDGKRRRVPVLLKEYWGEASRRANNLARYRHQGPAETFVPEGEDTVIPHRGSIHDPVDGLESEIDFIKRAIGDSGATSPREFSERVKLETQSAGSIEEGRPQ